MAIKFFFSETRITLLERKRLKLFIQLIFAKKRKRVDSLIYIFCSDQFLLNINRSFLKHDYYTDIITFDLSTSNKTVVGEIYISIDRVKENAKILNLNVNKELHRVIFHGALHICGYKDKIKKEKNIMTEAEDKLLKVYFS